MRSIIILAGLISVLTLASAAPQPASVLAQKQSAVYYFPDTPTFRRGDQNVEIVVHATNDESLKGFSVCLFFDPAVFECVDMTLEGTRAEGAELLVPGCATDYATAGVIYSYVCPPQIPAGDGPLLVIIANVKPDAPLGETILDLEDNPPSLNRVTMCGGSTVTPSLIDGAVVIADVMRMVSGTVTDAQGMPINGLTVVATDVATGTTAGTDTTDINGDYAVGLQLPGGYRIEVLSSGTYYMGEFYDDLPSYIPGNAALAQTVWVTYPPLVEGIDFELDEGGRFSGVVGDASDGSPLSDVSIVPFVFGADSLRSTVSLIDGTFESVPLPPAEYGAMTPGVGGYLGEFYPEAGDPGQAMPFSVILGQHTVGIDFTLDRDPVGVNAESPSKTAVALGMAVPNPFNPTTMIQYILTGPAHVKLRTYDAGGHPVRVLVNGHRAAGSHEVRWDGRNAQGRTLPSGVYFYELSVNGKVVAVRKATLLR